MSTALWIVQVLAAIVFLMVGVMKATQPKEKLAETERMAWVEGFSSGQIRMIGILEILGAIGLVLPVLTGILPWLTSLAALGLALTMVGAIITHVRRGEYPNIIGNLILMAMVAFVAYSLIFVSPIS